MLRKSLFLVLVTLLCVVPSLAQTTNGLFTGTITDSSGAAIPGAEISVTNQGTDEVRTVKSDASGAYIIPQLPPGIYTIAVKKEGFATLSRPGVQLLVNQDATLDLSLSISATQQTVQVTGTAQTINTTSATLGTVIEHQDLVDLPLNGREFTALALLTPGAAPVQNAQQGTFTVALGAGGISPSTNGQRGEMNNFTMDGFLNNQLFTNSWLISPPPDAIQEFNVQSHITDAQFSISTGANINVATRSGTNTLHGSVWEFNRNAAVEARNFFSANRLTYNQNQYGVYLGGPVRLPYFNGRDNTWFSGYWEGFRSVQTLPQLSGTFTAAEQQGDFSAFEGAQVGTDSLGRPEYANEIYDPNTSRPDPAHAGSYLRDPFQGNIIPPGEINAASQILLHHYFPLPNLNVAPTVLPNYEFGARTPTASDTVGAKIDHRFRNGDTFFAKYSRSNANIGNPAALPGNYYYLSNYGAVAGFGYTHVFGTATVLSLHYAYEKINLLDAPTNPGAAFNQSINYTINSASRQFYWVPPGLSISNGISTPTPGQGNALGPQQANEYHADLSKVKGHHTISVGGMFYHINYFKAPGGPTFSFTQNATAQDGTAGPTGWGPASFLMGLPDSGGGYAGNLENTAFGSWWAGYVQDQWRVTRKLTLTAGLRYDFCMPPGDGKVLAGFDFYTGQWHITRPYPPSFPAAIGPSTYYYPQTNGWQPRVGIAYRVSDKTVIRAAFAQMDDNNRLVQVNMGTSANSWPTGITVSYTQENRGLPNMYINNLPSSSSLLNPGNPIPGQSPDPNSPIPYALEYNFGIEQQLPGSMVLDLAYVGSVDRHLLMQAGVNGAQIPGPGAISTRDQRYPQYGIMTFDTDSINGSYNALQAELKKTLPAGLAFIASYTYSKSLDNTSDPYGNGPQDFYNLRAEWGPSDFNLAQLFTFSSTYALPVGHSKHFLSNSHGVVEAVAGNWNAAAIVSLRSGLPFECLAGADVANVGTGTERCDETGLPYAGQGFSPSPVWMTKASYQTIQYAWGTMSRNSLVGPAYHDVDFSLYKTIPIKERLNLQIRADAFNVFNDVSFSNPVNNFTSASFGKITSAYFPREIQFAAKLTF